MKNDPTFRCKVGRRFGFQVTVKWLLGETLAFSVLAQLRSTVNEKIKVVACRNHDQLSNQLNRLCTKATHFWVELLSRSACFCARWFQSLESLALDTTCGWGQLSGMRAIGFLCHCDGSSVSSPDSLLASSEKWGSGSCVQQLLQKPQRSITQ